MNSIPAAIMGNTKVIAIMYNFANYIQFIIMVTLIYYFKQKDSERVIIMM